MEITLDLKNSILLGNRLNAAYVINEDGTFREVVPKNGKKFKLKELYAVCKCDMVQVLHLRGSSTMWLDEEGKVHGKQIPNPLASEIAWACNATYPDDEIYGPVVVCPKSMVG